MNDLNFDLFALAAPKTRQDCEALAREVIAELNIIQSHFDRATALCEEQARKEGE